MRVSEQARLIVVPDITIPGIPLSPRCEWSDCAGYYYSWYSVEPAERAGWCRSDCGAGYYYSWYSVEPRTRWVVPWSDCGAGYYYSRYSVDSNALGGVGPITVPGVPISRIPLSLINDWHTGQHPLQ